MSKTERISLIQSIASRTVRVLSRCAEIDMNANQARRVLRRTCPRRHLNA